MSNVVATNEKAPWTEERVELLKKLWAEGLSASQIAGRLLQGVTRNAVIGKVHRLNLSEQPSPATLRPVQLAKVPANHQFPAVRHLCRRQVQQRSSHMPLLRHAL
jgi:hypothetical protein